MPSLYEMGCGAEASVSNSLTGPIMNPFRAKARLGVSNTNEVSAAIGAFIFPSEALNSIKALDSQWSTLDADIQVNVTRPAFLDNWKKAFSAWKEFAALNLSEPRIMLHGPGSVWNTNEGFRVQLTGWLNARKNENPSKPPPMGEISSPTKPSAVPDEKTSWMDKLLPSRKAVVVMTLLGVAATIGVVLYAYLSYRTAKKGVHFIAEHPEVLGPEGAAIGVAAKALRDEPGDLTHG
mgnify:CR=1 FL=1